MAALTEIVRYYRRVIAAGRREPDFFEFVRRVEAASGERAGGKSSARRSEPLRFGQLPHLHYPPRMIAEILERNHPMVFVYFFGLWGPNGPMPLGLTGYVHQRMHNHGDHAQRRFADLIHHRFLGLYYRAWKMNEQAVGLDKPDGGLIAGIVRSLSGETAPGFTAAKWAGLFGSAVKSRDGLESLLGGAFPRFKIRVRDHLESTARIPSDARARLGRRGVSSLGTDLQLGSVFTSRTRKFAIEIAACAFDAAKAFLPGAEGFRRLTELTLYYLDRPLEWDLKLNVEPKTIPAPRLGAGLALGRSLWLGGGAKANGRLVIGASRLCNIKNWR